MQPQYSAKLEATSWDPKLEAELRQMWEYEMIFDFKPSNNKNLNFVMDTPPPYPSGKPWHPGALTQYTQIDMIARSARMRGLNVLYPIGIDRNGLPVEIFAERKYRVQMRKTPREEFINLCKHALDDLETYMVGLLKTLGISGDYYNKYRTDSEDYRKLTQWSFIELWNKGLIYVANRPNNYCPDCNTTIADAEIEYDELPTFLVTNAFRVKDSRFELPVATTRPELLAACQMLVVNPTDTRYKKFVGKSAIVPIYNKEVPIKAHKSVDPKFGSGVVMVCSYGDYNDVMLFREFKLKEVVAVDMEGKMTSVTGKYAGTAIKDARAQIIQDLQDIGVARKVEQIQHRTPLCERSKTPIEIIPMEEYYLKQLEFRQALKKIAKKMEFHPAMHRQILFDWIDTLTTDYPISRRRYYATEIPVWYCSKCGTPHLPKPGVYYRPWRDEAPFKKCKKCGNTKFVGETRTFDTWMDSSLSPLYVSKHMKNARFHNLTYPTTVRVQGKDIVRTWLYYTMLKCYQLTGKEPFKHVWIGGMGQDAQGRKMSKSLGNFVDAEPILVKSGADAFRFWGASEAGLGYDFRFSEERIVGAGKFLTKLWNTCRFISSFPIPEKAELTWTDKWMLNELGKLTESCVDAYGSFDVFTVSTKTREFLWNVFASNYLEMAKGRAYGDNATKAEQEAAWYTLHKVVKTLLLLLAPIIPYLTDYTWRKLYGTQSIHLELFPKAEKFEVSEKMGLGIMEFNAQVWKTKRDKGLALKDPIAVRVPVHLKHFEKDLVRMHHITK
ncbi:MAG: valine--tRNA ligase [Nitrososphaerota archaeon]|nr:valine--tRNA ligase [Nitrososphaerota archaeon]MDG6918248.1 valine--tRNA ligase [Nitrososphaerota archaeon]